MTMESEPNKKDLKPKIYKSDARRPTITFRVRGDTFDNIKAAAAANDMSISEEIEKRIDKSFLHFGGNAVTEATIRLILANLDTLEAVMEGKWQEDDSIAIAWGQAAKYIIMETNRLSMGRHKNEDLARALVEVTTRARSEMIGSVMAQYILKIKNKEDISDGSEQAIIEALTEQHADAQRRAREIAAEALRSPRPSQDTKPPPEPAPQAPEPGPTKPPRSRTKAKA